MQAKRVKIASLIVTYNRIEEAKAQMDIIRELWQPMFEGVDIYHEFNGEKKWYPKKYKEDFFHIHKKMPHFIGANHMINQGMKRILESGKKYDYIIATSADVWFYDPKKLKKIILTIARKKHQLATSIWGLMALGTEFLLITPDLAKKVFPIKFRQFIGTHKLFRWTNTKLAIFESIFTFKVMRVLKNPKKIYLIPGRRTVLLKNRFYSPNFYASHHDRSKRKRDLLPKIGPYSRWPCRFSFGGSNPDSVI